MKEQRNEQRICGQTRFDQEVTSEVVEALKGHRYSRVGAQHVYAQGQEGVKAQIFWVGRHSMCTQGQEQGRRQCAQGSAGS